MSSTTAKTSTATALATTVALTAAVAAWQWHQQSRQAKSFLPEQDLDKTTEASAEEGQVTPREMPHVMVVEPKASRVEPVKPVAVMAAEEEEDSLSATDRSTSSDSEDNQLDKTVEEEEEEEDKLDKTMDETMDEDDVVAQTEESEEEANEEQSRPDPEQVKAVGFDADEVPKNVRVVQSLNAMQYTGEVGSGSRCIRAIDALPKPATFKTVVTKKIPPKTKGRKNKKTPVTTITTLVAEPFVEAFQLEDGSECTTPRLASYFEVNILAGPQDGIDETSMADEKHPCIAVGISLHQFNWERSMPGWNVLSFGYHSDDGASFFARNKQAYGPVYGAGDTVGCGIDYAKRRVFYTLNGKFLGHSFELNGKQLSTGKWIPTIGMDSHAAVEYNKSGPFKFDLTFMSTEKAQF